MPTGQEAWSCHKGQTSRTTPSLTLAGASDGGSLSEPRYRTPSSIEPELPRIKVAARGLSYDFSTLEGEIDLALVAPLVSMAFLSGSGADLMALRDMAGRLHTFGVETVCITRGAEGAFWSSGGSEILQPSLPATIRDTMGAGDAFIAGYLAASLQGAAPERAFHHAASTAALACGWSGAWGHAASAEGL